MAGIIQNEGHNPYPVAATGFLLGSQVTLVLYGIHICQVSRYYARFGRSDKKKYRWVLVPAVFGLSSIHIGMIIFSAHHYFVKGISETSIWDTFYNGLSGQDFIIPMMSFVSHVFFGHRIYILRDIKRHYWIMFVCFAAITCAVGIVFAALARVWSMNPFQTEEEFNAMKIGPVADAFPTAWLTCAAAIDGGLTATLVYVLLKDRKYNSHTKRLLYEIAGLTLETVLLTHIIGAVLFVLWLTSRTRTNVFWFLIEIIAECYALSVLFTLNSRSRFRRTAQPNTEQMFNRQLDNMEGANGGSSSALPQPQEIMLVPQAARDRITRVHSTDLADPEKVDCATTRVSAQDEIHKLRNGSGSSSDSSGLDPDQGFLPVVPRMAVLASCCDSVNRNA